MKGEARRAAIMAYKERKAMVGVYAVRCAPAGAVWVGGSPNLDTIQNRIWFTLRTGGQTDAGLQAAWRDHGADAFSFEVLEEFDEEAPAYVRAIALKERTAHWRQALDARPI
ncbi:GIY-YIG nuclease family protein [Bradyrhizobium sp. 2TAF24]|uniref:GIY-YIG nuclease family protein n=1 Tax=Bradyrhizobium sp. 2TAF24 TaxID=3233011 RepID=UPI003F93A3C6